MKIRIGRLFIITGISSLSLALLFGDYPISNYQEINDVFTEYSYDGSFPYAFANNISGFYFDGKIEMPIPYVPNYELDFELANLKYNAMKKTTL